MATTVTQLLLNTTGVSVTPTVNGANIAVGIAANWTGLVAVCLKSDVHSGEQGVGLKLEYSIDAGTTYSLVAMTVQQWDLDRTEISAWAEIPAAAQTSVLLRVRAVATQGLPAVACLARYLETEAR